MASICPVSVYYVPQRRYSRRRRTVAASAEASRSAPLVVGTGGCGVDYLATVAKFPKPDQKLRTETLDIQGGGNVGNALVAAQRLGLQTRILSKIGDDTVGQGILKEFQDEGVYTTSLIQSEGQSSPWTYIIVDKSGGTRTCIHTPGSGQPLSPDDLSPHMMTMLLDGATLAYFDGRLTEAAVAVAIACTAKQVPILVEAERLRPNLESLMADADYLVTSSNFPEDWTGEECLGDAMLATALRLPRLTFMVTTLGKRGAVMLVLGPSTDERDAAQSAELQATIDHLFEELDSQGAQKRLKDGPPDCVSDSGVQIQAGRVTSTPGFINLQFDRRGSKEQSAVERALAASLEAAQLNADTHNSEEYLLSQDINDSDTESDYLQLCAKVYVTSSASLAAENVEDTTGAGDAFIGSLLYGISSGMPVDSMLRLAVTVAACKCTGIGARPALPRRSNLSSHILPEQHV